MMQPAAWQRGVREPIFERTDRFQVTRCILTSQMSLQSNDYTILNAMVQGELHTHSRKQGFPYIRSGSS
jgi:hypothetical protein